MHEAFSARRALVSAEFSAFSGGERSSAREPRLLRGKRLDFPRHPLLLPAEKDMVTVETSLSPRKTTSSPPNPRFSRGKGRCSSGNIALHAETERGAPKRSLSTRKRAAVPPGIIGFRAETMGRERRPTPKIAGRALVAPVSSLRPGGRALVAPATTPRPGGRSLVAPATPLRPPGRAPVAPGTTLRPTGRRLVSPATPLRPLGRGLVAPATTPRPHFRRCGRRPHISLVFRPPARSSLRRKRLPKAYRGSAAPPAKRFSQESLPRRTGKRAF